MAPELLDAYPKRNINRLKRTRPETAILVKVHYPTAGQSVEWPNADQARVVFRATAELARTNAYQNGFSIDFVEPSGGGLPFFEIDLPGSPPRFFGPVDFIDAVARFEALYGFSPWEHDHVVLITPVGQQYFAQGLNKYVQFTQDGGSGFGASPEKFAPGLMHEMGHGYGFSHANTIGTLTSRSSVLPRGRRDSDVLGYGDIFDYMGEISHLGWRNNPQCWPAGTQLTFAGPTDIHLNPIRKWQLGWLDDSAIYKVPPRTPTPGSQLPSATLGLALEIPLAPITSPTGIRAIQIERGYDSNGVPLSLFVYWRNNEDLAKGGASIALASRESIAQTTVLIDRRPGPPISSACPVNPKTPPPTPANPNPVVREPRFPGWTVALPRGGEWRDAVRPASVGASSGTEVILACGQELTENGELLIRVDNSRQRQRPFSNIPILEVTCPIIESGKIIKNSDVISFVIRATNPEKDPTRLGWVDIDRVETEFAIREGPGPNGRAVLQLASGPSTQRTFRSADQALRGWSFLARELVDPARIATFPMRIVVALVATAYTKSGSSASGGLRFILDQVGP